MTAAGKYDFALPTPPGLAEAIYTGTLTPDQRALLGRLVLLIGAGPPVPTEPPAVPAGAVTWRDAAAVYKIARQRYDELVDAWQTGVGQ